MKLAVFSVDGTKQLGAVQEDRVFLLSEYPPCVKSFIESGESIPSLEGRPSHHLADVAVHIPIAAPEKIICVGLNYIDHCRETGMEPPKSPVIFSKYANALTGHNSDVEIPVNSKEVDFEAELAIVIGKEAKRVSEEEAEEYVFGYTIMNDVSARDLQFADGQWSRGKTADTFAPTGPYVVTRDEVGDPHNLSISLTLNGEIMQDSNTSNLIFTVPQIISFLSQSMTLKPGDLIATGTPPGVGMGRSPKVWLKNGDQMEVTIEKIGTLSNRVRGH
ncbi:fumarylacetoacetate hydrolase family protein [Domibacillus enclensis]|uniref:2-keto-4-pentenoate hydratase/2-oxohepta-3-ene-1,7-dioic acid hydratase (Catechol pathway) n=1 Tax=Domibacillus enclensis TaxID=1017273 RepID=A0A1N6RJ52_9BACI|nr:fumarylacetoacetate hydrolase family protein [Domibacillus enclensis]OXS79074.1 fumarylacetoacetate hydrolase [Domibacillus enclensis]SIQ28910.1 2-keto-4-pentenoate hydratase/2-oxohepta-3-ene-1,7-dioic acid hydratase (catechol pathway) [Domibacillus enclensis]